MTQYSQQHRSERFLGQCCR